MKTAKELSVLAATVRREQEIIKTNEERLELFKDIEIKAENGENSLTVYGLRDSLKKELTDLGFMIAENYEPRHYNSDVCRPSLEGNYFSKLVIIWGDDELFNQLNNWVETAVDVGKVQFAWDVKHDSKQAVSHGSKTDAPAKKKWWQL